MTDGSANTNDNTSDIGEEPFGGIYALFMLDHIVELTSRLAFDVMKRPAQFSGLPADITEMLDGFRTRIGTEPDWPDASQRGQIFDSFLGPAFTANSAGYRLTVLKFAEGASSVNQDIHDHALADAASAMKSLLAPTRQQAMNVGYRRVSALFERALRIWRSVEVRQAFGIHDTPDRRWPFGTPSSDAETQLLDEVFRQSGQTHCQSWGRYYFASLQRVAYFGRLTISSIVNEDNPSTPRDRRAVDFGYRWTRALHDLLPAQTVIRAWKQPSIRAELSGPEQLHLPPNPAGEIDTTNANLTEVAGSGTQRAGQTFTVQGEICCSTTPSVSCMSHCPPPDDIQTPGGSTYPCCTHHC